MVNSIEFFPNGVRVKFSGRVTAQEILDTNSEILNHSNFSTTKFSIWVYQDIGQMEYSKGQIRALGDSDRATSLKNPDRQVAIVADSPYVFGLGRMYEAYYGDGPWKIKIFYDLNEAEEWVKFHDQEGVLANLLAGS